VHKGKEVGGMTNRRTGIRRTLFAGAVGIGTHQLWRHGHDYVFMEQFREVEPGKIYRGAWQKPWPMRRLVHDYQIKTIVALAHPEDHDLSVQERNLARDLRVDWIHIPIVDRRGTNDRAAEDAISDLLDRAASILADPASYPVFFHCHHGLNRTSMVQIAYRTKYCGWTLDQAAEEIDRSIGLVKVSRGPDYRHMVSYYQNRVLPLRQHQAEAAAAAHRDLTARVEPTVSSSSR
jgi:protein-tyrosine phosphatase